jgi:hypothetical protein
MNTKPKFYNIILAYTAWIVDMGLGLWLFLLSRQALQAWIATYYLTGNFTRRMSVRFIDQGFSILLGLALLIYMIVSEYYFRVGVGKGMLPRRIARMTGPIILLIGLVDLFLVFMLGAAQVGAIRWILVIAELLIGGAITWFGFRRKSTGHAPNLTPFTGVK